MNDFRAVVLSMLEIMPASCVMDAFEGAFLKELMERLGHNQSQVAHVLGINRATLRTRLRFHGLLPLKTSRSRPTLNAPTHTLRV